MFDQGLLALRYNVSIVFNCVRHLPRASYHQHLLQVIGIRCRTGYPISKISYQGSNPNELYSIPSEIKLWLHPRVARMSIEYFHFQSFIYPVMQHNV